MRDVRPVEKSLDVGSRVRFRVAEASRRLAWPPRIAWGSRSRPGRAPAVGQGSDPGGPSDPAWSLEVATALGARGLCGRWSNPWPGSTKPPTWVGEAIWEGCRSLREVARCDVLAWIRSRFGDAANGPPQWRILMRRLLPRREQRSSAVDGRRPRSARNSLNQAKFDDFLRWKRSTLKLLA